MPARCLFVRSLFPLLFANACLLGCGQGEKVELPPAHPVTGVVTLDGEPIQGAILKFIPQGGTSGGDCYGVTDSSGTYTLTQLRGEEGAQVGAYAVVIEYHLKPDGTPLQEGEMPRDVGASQVLPARYSVLQSTKLSADVPDGGGEFNFELTSK